jgi:glycerophosphoryl diester phosphodiesterase
VASPAHACRRAGALCVKARQTKDRYKRTGQQAPLSPPDEPMADPARAQSALRWDRRLTRQNPSQDGDKVPPLPFLDHEGPIAFAHRGGALHNRENSMAAFTQAVALGYEYLETDVHATADGVLIAFHDATLDRVTDRTGVVAEMPWREVRMARIGGVEPIPLLVEVLEHWPQVRVNVDPKSDAAVQPLVEVIERTGTVDRICVGSFSDRRLRRIRVALGPRLCTSMGPREVIRLRLGSWGKLPKAIVSQDAACVQIPVRHGRILLAEPRLLTYAHVLRLPVHVWTVNNPEEMRRLVNLGVDGIISDNLVALRAVLREHGAWPSMEQ